MTGPASFTPQPYPLRLIERVWGHAVRSGMVIGWTSDGTGFWKPVVAFDGEVAAIEATVAEGGVWEFQVPEAAPAPRVLPRPAPVGDTEASPAASPTTESVLGMVKADEPEKRKRTGREAVTGAPGFNPPPVPR